MDKNKKILEGSQAIAAVISNIQPGVVSAYPITPQTHIVEKLAKLKADGQGKYEYVRAESEFAAASIVLGASAAGIRSYSATSSQGLLLMSEVVFNIAGMRLPVVMTCANRAISAPINIWCFEKGTQVLMADLTYKAINKIKIGDTILGKNKKGRLTYSKVTKLFSRQTDDLVKLKMNNMEIVCTPEHEFYYHGGHNHFSKAKNLKNKELHYFGHNYEINDEFKKGWLTGVADGDGSFFYKGNICGFRLKCKDKEIVETFVLWSNYFKFPVRKYSGLEKNGYFVAILTLSKEAKSLSRFLTKKGNKDFARGYLAGIYDAEGTGPHKVKQAVIYNNDQNIVKTVSNYLKLLNLSFKVYADNRKEGFHKNDNYHVKINNVPEFFVKCPPRISRKRDNLLKMSLKSVKSRVKVLNVATLVKKTTVYNIETESNNYIVNGLLVHNCDHSDIMSVRDAGWISLFAGDNQEAVDLHILAYKLAEQLHLPVFVNVDGFILTHAYEPVIIPDKKLIKKYLPDYKPTEGTYLNPTNPKTLGAFFPPAHYMETRQDLHNDLTLGLEVIKKEYKSLNKTLGRKNNDNGLIKYYGPKRPEIVLVALGSVIGTMRETVNSSDQLRKKVGILQIKTYRPFPAKEINKILSGVKNIAVIEKAISFGQAGPLFSDLQVSLEKKVNSNNFIVGLGGRDITQKTITEIIKKATKKNICPTFITTI